MKLKTDFDFPRIINLPGGKWLTDGHVAVRLDLTSVDERTELPVITPDPAKYATRATSTEQTSDPIGVNTAALLWLNHDDAGLNLTVHDSEKPDQHVICLDGQMVGFAAAITTPMQAPPWTPTVDQIPKAIRVANEISRFTWMLDEFAWEAGKPADTMTAAYAAIMACYTPEPESEADHA